MSRLSSRIAESAFNYLDLSILIAIVVLQGGPTVPVGFPWLNFGGTEDGAALQSKKTLRQAQGEEEASAR